MTAADTRAQLAAAVARSVPRFIKSWVHANRHLGRIARRVFSTLVGPQKGRIRIGAGPLAGMHLAVSEHVSHAHVAGTYEAATTTAVDRLVQPGFICYDLGASIGYISLVMARKAAHVFCFEPAPHAATEIRRNMAANDRDNYTIIEEPVSDAVQRIQFALTDVAYGSGITRGQTDWPVLELTSTTLDLFIRNHPAPDFVKIDVEGEEYRVLASATDLLARRRTIICCELHTEENARQVREILEGRDYRMMMVDGTPVDWSRHVTAGELQIVAYPAEMALPKLSDRFDDGN